MDNSISQQDKIENEPIADCLTIPEVCKILKISRPTLKRMLAEKKIKARKVGHQWRFQQKDLREFLDDQSNSGAGEGER